MERFFSTEMSGVAFLRNVLLMSIAGLLPVLVLFLVLSTGLVSSLIQGGPNLSYFARQIVTNGLPVVFAINYIGFFLLTLTAAPSERRHSPALLLLIDVFARVALFFVLHALIYVWSAEWFGSFGGNRRTALSVVAPTLSRSAFLENISGVYLYATLVSAIPLYISGFKRMPRLEPLNSKIPFSAGPALMAPILFVAVVVLITSLAEIFSGL